MKKIKIKLSDFDSKIKVIERYANLGAGLVVCGIVVNWTFLFYDPYIIPWLIGSGLFVLGFFLISRLFNIEIVEGD